MGREASRVSFLICPFCVSVFYVGNAPFRKPRRTRDLRRDRSFRLQQRPSTNASDEHICSDLPLPLFGNARYSQVGRIHHCDRCLCTVGAA